MLLIPAVLIVGGILALVLYLEKTSPPYQPFDALQDEFYRAFATHQLIDACMVTGEEVLARALLVSIGMISSVTRSMNSTRRFGLNESGR